MWIADENDKFIFLDYFYELHVHAVSLYINLKAFIHYFKSINVNEVYDMLLDCCLLVADLVFAIKPACLTNIIWIGKTREVRLEYDHQNTILSLCTMLLYVIKFYIQGQVWLWLTDAWATRIERGKSSEQLCVFRYAFL